PNSAAGRGSFAAGSGAKALHDGAFVWSGFAVPSNFASSTTNEFAVRATGGVRIVSAVDFVGAPLAGVTLPAGSGSWTTLSDRSSKTNFAAVNAPELLERVARLPIQTWNYKAQKEAIRHIGPTAQDFAAAFHVGEDDKHIATVDEGGVALAAIQGLNQKPVDELKRRHVEWRQLHTGRRFLAGIDCARDDGLADSIDTTLRRQRHHFLGAGDIRFHPGANRQSVVALLVCDAQRDHKLGHCSHPRYDQV